MHKSNLIFSKINQKNTTFELSVSCQSRHSLKQCIIKVQDFLASYLLELDRILQKQIKNVFGLAASTRQSQRQVFYPYNIEDDSSQDSSFIDLFDMLLLTLYVDISGQQEEFLFRIRQQPQVQEKKCRNRKHFHNYGNDLIVGTVKTLQCEKVRF